MLKFTAVSVVRTASIITVIAPMETARTSETSLDFNVTTWRYFPEDFILAVVRT
jgi:hypothetical protein